MRIRVKLYITSGKTLGEIKEIDLPDDSIIADLLERLCAEHITLRSDLFLPSGQINPSVIILKNGRHIVALGGTKARVNEGDTITIFEAISGG